MTRSKLSRVERSDQMGLYARLSWFVTMIDARRHMGYAVTVDGIMAGLRILETDRTADATDRAVAEMARLSEAGSGYFSGR